MDGRSGVQERGAIRTRIQISPWREKRGRWQGEEAADKEGYVGEGKEKQRQSTLTLPFSIPSSSSISLTNSIDRAFLLQALWPSSQPLPQSC